jgi:CHAT domain-containing protein/tetratricopeptide (TPR) repeat protein
MYRSLYPEGHENLAGALSAMGDLSRTLSKARESDQYSREAAEMIRRLPQAKPDLRGTVFLNRGNALSTLGRFEEAREVLGEASAAYRVGPGTAPGEAFVANALAVMSIAEGRYEEADQALQEVVRVRIALFGEPDKRVAVVRNNLASVKRMRGALVEAEDLFAQAANTIRSIGNKDPDLIPVLGSLGGLRREKMDYEGAEAAFDEAMRVAEALPRPTRELAILLHNKGVLEHERGRLPQAKELFEKSLALKRNILPAGNTGILQDEYALALLLRDMGEEEKAEQKFKECLAGFEKGPNGMPREQSLTLNQLANLARAKGHFADAEKHLKKAISVSTASMGPRNPNLASLKKDLGTLLRLQGKAGEATLPYTEAVRLRGLGLSMNLLALSDEERRKASADFIAERGVYLTYAVANNAPELGAETLRIVKGFRLAAQREVAGRIRTNAGPEGEKLTQANVLLAQQIRAQQALPSRAGTVSKLREQLRSNERRLSQLAGYRDWAAEVTEETVRKKLGDRTAFLDIASYRKFDPAEKGNRFVQPTYSGFLYTGKGPVQAIDIGDAEPINDGVGRILKLLDLVWQNDKLLPAAGLEANRLRVVEESRKLSSLLLPAVLRALPAGIEHLIISPDSELAGLPWELLIDSEGRYLIERVRISYADSARTLVSPLSKTSEAPPVLFTDPRYNLSSQGSLAPGTRRAGSKRNPLRAGANLGRLYQGRIRQALQGLAPDTVVRSGLQATEANLAQTKEPRMLVVWTHGEFDSGNTDPAQRPRIQLAGTVQRMSPSRSHDGVLTAAEMSRLYLQGTRLAVIAGCQTGVGTPTPGEGIEGIRRALWVAGAQGQLVTSWGVADVHTAHWLEEFFTTLRNSRIPIAEAVRVVQLRFLQGEVKGLDPSQIHPVFWAPFTFAGDPGLAP